MKYKAYNTLKDLKIMQKFGRTQYAIDHPGYYSNGVHKGWDYGGRRGTPIPSELNGMIVKTQYKIKYNDNGQPVGKGLVVSVWDMDQNLAVRYCHLSKINVKVGDIIKAGDIIGELGNTGFSKGSHLHREFVETNDNAEAINKKNIYKGCIDPDKYIEFIDLEIQN